MFQDTLCFMALCVSGCCVFQSAMSHDVFEGTLCFMVLCMSGCCVFQNQSVSESECHVFQGTSLAFFKRLWVNNSPMDYHPKDIM